MWQVRGVSPEVVPRATGSDTARGPRATRCAPCCGVCFALPEPAARGGPGVLVVAGQSATTRSRGRRIGAARGQAPDSTGAMIACVPMRLARLTSTGARLPCRLCRAYRFRLGATANFGFGFVVAPQPGECHGSPLMSSGGGHASLEQPVLMRVARDVAHLFRSARPSQCRLRTRGVHDGSSTRTRRWGPGEGHRRTPLPRLRMEASSAVGSRRFSLGGPALRVGRSGVQCPTDRGRGVLRAAENGPAASEKTACRALVRRSVARKALRGGVFRWRTTSSHTPLTWWVPTHLVVCQSDVKRAVDRRRRRSSLGHGVAQFVDSARGSGTGLVSWEFHEEIRSVPRHHNLTGAGQRAVGLPDIGDARGTTAA